ncbi:MAG: metal ABC transporter solute-binding protein, Zn/Mn family [Paracoccaceae bacterium]
MLNRRTILGFALSTPLMAQIGHAAGPLNVVATTGMIADTAARIGGAQVAVTGLMGAGVDPHSYRQTRNDIVALTRADLVLWHGLFLEAQMEDFFARLAVRQPVVAVTDQLKASALDGTGPALIDSPDYAGAYDPHIWMDPDLWAEIADRIARAFTELRPDSSDVFQTNAAAFKTELTALRAYGSTALADIPQDRRVLLTAHDAFSYFGDAFGMEVIGVQGISTDSEAGLHRMRSLVDVLVSRQIGAVFVESSVSDRNIRALIEGAAAQGHSVNLGGELFSDAMGPAGTYEGTYIGMMDHNITKIARALGSDVPAAGLNGKLGAGG